MSIVLTDPPVWPPASPSRDEDMALITAALNADIARNVFADLERANEVIKVLDLRDSCGVPTKFGGATIRSVVTRG